MRTIAWGFAIIVVAGLIVMAAAGFTAATAILVTAGAIVGMIFLGNLVGGRTTANKSPITPGSGSAPDAGLGADTRSAHDRPETSHSETSHAESSRAETASAETASAETASADTVDSEVSDGGATES